MSQIAQKRNQFTISIRKKAIQEKMSQMRAQFYSRNQSQQMGIQQAQIILSQVSEKNFGQKLSALKLLSWQPQVVNKLIPLLDNICDYIIYSQSNLALHLDNQNNFQDSINIFINICAILQIKVSDGFMFQLAKMILIPERQNLVYWALANLLCKNQQHRNLDHHNQQSKMLLQLLVKIQISDFIIKKVQNNFKDKESLVIFNYFCLSLLANGQFLNYSQYSQLLDTLQKIQDYGLQQTDWYFTQVLIDHAPYVNQQNYEIFNRNLFKKLEQYVINKKTKIVKSYLLAILKFIEHQNNNQDSYERFLRYGLLKHMRYCLQNRSQQIKKICTDIALILIDRYSQYIDLENHDFFIDLSLDITNIEKYKLDLQISSLKYLQKILILSQKVSGISQILKIVQQLNLIYIISTIIQTNTQLISPCICILQVLIELNKQYSKQIQKYKIIDYLYNFQTNNQQINNCIHKFLQKYFKQ